MASNIPSNSNDYRRFKLPTNCFISRKIISPYLPSARLELSEFARIHNNKTCCSDSLVVREYRERKRRRRRRRKRRRRRPYEEVISRCCCCVGAAGVFLVLPLFLSSIVYSPFFPTVVGRRCLSGSPFTAAYRYTLSHYYRNHSAARRRERGLYFLNV